VPKLDQSRVATADCQSVETKERNTPEHDF
jgi:hypothetical protein